MSSSNLISNSFLEDIVCTLMSSMVFLNTCFITVLIYQNFFQKLRIIENCAIIFYLTTSYLEMVEILDLRMLYYMPS